MKLNKNFLLIGKVSVDNYDIIKAAKNVVWIIAAVFERASIIDYKKWLLKTDLIPMIKLFWSIKLYFWHSFYVVCEVSILSDRILFSCYFV